VVRQSRSTRPRVYASRLFLLANETGRAYLFTKTVAGWRQVRELKDIGSDEVAKTDGHDGYIFRLACRYRWVDARGRCSLSDRRRARVSIGHLS
jgi:hypothetical protein